MSELEDDTNEELLHLILAERPRSNDEELLISKLSDSKPKDYFL